MTSLRDYVAEIRKLSRSALAGSITPDDIEDRLSDIIDAIDLIAETLENLDSGLRSLVS